MLSILNLFHSRTHLENYSICIALKQLKKAGQGGCYPGSAEASQQIKIAAHLGESTAIA